MEVVKQSHEILNTIDWDNVLLQLELPIRKCYNSEHRIKEGSAEKLIRTVISNKHVSTLEHFSFSVNFITNRGVTHELVRHRMASYSQVSTRYVNYGGRDMQYILPVWMDDTYLGHYSDKPLVATDITTPEGIWIESCMKSESAYKELLRMDSKPEQAREVLNNSLQTDITMTTTVRDWIHLLGLRCDKTAHPQIRSLMRGLHSELVDTCPVLFDSVMY